MSAMNLVMFGATLVFAGVTLAFYLLSRLLNVASPPSAAGLSGHGCILTMLWLIPLVITGVMFGLAWA